MIGDHAPNLCLLETNPILLNLNCSSSTMIFHYYLVLASHGDRDLPMSILQCTCGLCLLWMSRASQTGFFILPLTELSPQGSTHMSLEIICNTTKWLTL